MAMHLSVAQLQSMSAARSLAIETAAAVPKALNLKVYETSLVAHTIIGANQGDYSGLMSEIQSGKAQVLILDAKGCLHLFQPSEKFGAPKWSERHALGEGYVDDMTRWVRNGDCVMISSRFEPASGRKSETTVFHLNCRELPKEEGKDDGSKEVESSASASSPTDTLLSRIRVIHAKEDGTRSTYYSEAMKKKGATCTCSLKDRVTSLKNIPHYYQIDLP